METIELKENGIAEKTNAQKCMDEIERILKEYNCEPVCAPQRIYGQTVYVWAVQEIKK